MESRLSLSLAPGRLVVTLEGGRCFADVSGFFVPPNVSARELTFDSVRGSFPSSGLGTPIRKALFCTRWLWRRRDACWRRLTCGVLRRLEAGASGRGVPKLEFGNEVL